ncbi:MAG: hypothetical protein V8K32_02505 [Candidatus Electrothrix gigas]
MVQEHNENAIEQAASQPVEEKGNSEVSSDSASDGGATLSPSAGKQSCSACSDTSYVYALGKVETRISSLSVEKEFAQVIARTNTEGMTDKQALHAVLSDPQNRYLVREVCWVLTVEGLETYILQPKGAIKSAVFSIIRCIIAYLSVRVVSLKEKPKVIIRVCRPFI